MVFLKKFLEDWLRKSSPHIKTGSLNKALQNRVSKILFMNMVTAKEREILGLMAMGFSTKEIASRLNISFHTVESHRKNLRLKFDAKNSSELLMKVIQRSML